MSYSMSPQWEVWSESQEGRLLCQSVHSTRAAAESQAEHLKRRAALPDTGERYWCKRVWIREQ